MEYPYYFIITVGERGAWIFHGNEMDLGQKSTHKSKIYVCLDGFDHKKGTKKSHNRIL